MTTKSKNREKFNSPLGLTAVGSGPKIVRRTLPFIILSIIAGIIFSETLKFPGLNSNIILAFGWILLILGLITWLIAVVQFAISFPKGMLVTNGVLPCRGIRFIQVTVFWFYRVSRLFATTGVSLFRP
jgi:hypothetical protein